MRKLRLFGYEKLRSREAASVTGTRRFAESYDSCVVLPFRSMMAVSDPVVLSKSLCSPFGKVIVHVLPLVSVAAIFAGAAAFQTNVPLGPQYQKPKDQKLPSPREYFIKLSLPRNTRSSKFERQFCPNTPTLATL